MSEEIHWMKCPKCGKGAKKVYDIEEVEKAYPNNIVMQVAMKREYICIDVPCSHTYKATTKQLLNAFHNKKKAEGTTASELAKELDEGIKEMKERFSSDETGDNNENYH